MSAPHAALDPVANFAAIALATRILAAFEPPFALKGGEARTTPSIGIALSDPRRDANDLRDLLKRADHAMYRAKAAGKGQYAVYDPALDADPTAA